MTPQEQKFMKQHDLYVRSLQFITKFDFFAFLYVLRTKHSHYSNATTSKSLYYEIYNADFVYEGVEIASDDRFVHDKSSQFREEIKRFVAIQDNDLNTIYSLLKININSLTPLEVNDINQCVNNLSYIFQSILGGTIRYFTDEKSKSANPQRKYYFEPAATESTMDLLSGMILCNQLISIPIKYELLDLMTPMNMAFDNPLKNAKIKKKRNHEISIPSESMAFLDNGAKLFNAIQNKYQVEISYGIYEGNSSNEVSFAERSRHTINPYALLWNEGYYYVIATIAGESQPMHYRVDRIISVKPHKDEKNDKLIKRNPIPEILLEYFKKGSGIERDIFLADKYVHEHPNMRLYHKSNKITCEFEIIDWEIQMLVDTFGTDIAITELKDKKGSPFTRTDYYGREKQLYKAIVHDVQYENALAFCLTHAEYITVRKPDRLVKDVKKKLQEMLERLS